MTPGGWVALALSWAIVVGLVRGWTVHIAGSVLAQALHEAGKAFATSIVILIAILSASKLLV